jgi:DNA-3-methyladenine glycosylase I
MKPSRCAWINKDPLYIRYHDEEWGVIVRDDTKWFEFILLDGFQAGLSWYTIIKKRDRFREVFDGFDPAVVATYSEEKVHELLNDPGIIRNRLKIYSAVTNAKAFLEIQAEYGSFDTYIWQFTGGKPIRNAWTQISQVPATTAESDAMSKALKNRGFKFVGSTICYAFMQAAGMVNDHTTDCFRYHDCHNQDFHL